MHVVLELLKFLHLIRKHFLIMNSMVRDIQLIPPRTDPTLRAIRPIPALLNIVVAEGPRQNDTVHVVDHRVLIQDLRSYLIDTHKHEGDFAPRPLLLFLNQLEFSSLPLPFHFQLVHHTERIAALVGAALCGSCRVHLSIIFREVTDPRQRLNLRLEIRRVSHALLNRFLLLDKPLIPFLHLSQKQAEFRTL